MDKNIATQVNITAILNVPSIISLLPNDKLKTKDGNSNVLLKYFRYNYFTKFNY